MVPFGVRLLSCWPGHLGAAGGTRTIATAPAPVNVMLLGASSASACRPAVLACAFVARVPLLALCCGGLAVVHVLRRSGAPLRLAGVLTAAIAGRRLDALVSEASLMFGRRAVLVRASHSAGAHPAPSHSCSFVHPVTFLWVPKWHTDNRVVPRAPSLAPAEVCRSPSADRDALGCVCGCWPTCPSIGYR